MQIGVNGNYLFTSVWPIYQFVTHGMVMIRMGAGQISALLAWWNDLEDRGKKNGQYTNCEKTVLLVNPDKYDFACIIFKDTGIKIITGGVRRRRCIDESVVAQ